MNQSFKKFKDINLDKFLRELEIEWNHQDNKFPNQIHTLEKWLVIVMEEIGEIAKEVIEIHESNDFDKLKKEILQAITLLIRIKYSVYSIQHTRKFVINI